MDDVDLYNIPEVGRFLVCNIWVIYYSLIVHATHRRLHVRIDYDFGARSLVITMASGPHEYGVQMICEMLEPHMKLIRRNLEL